MKLLHNIFLSLVLSSSAAFSVSAMAAPDATAANSAPQAISQPESGSGSKVVNINTANAQQIADSMNGIGVSKARAIIEYRDTHGKFTSLEELEKVAGIGAKTIEKNKANLAL
jgi:competence protein ComEA